ncbi:NAD-dependent epimerase/dehydratase family protein [Thermogemmatispora sp.]|uniref:NAD-dependent epimerase/dehydratase family protein n=1 Tax=Thermogemmatispora sp. TaxID=1968838 RepID=UPI001E0235F3|nr:NAD-dependent epimerase/dehydratase family protein [Thermogemmatispora sp.]MBX5451507.1 NAD-dependent epimerase/dehydratase family protein [Thermogemmatispora sp.]
MVKIAITGGAGFIGAQLTRACLEAGHQVIVIDSLANGARERLDPRVRFYQLDIRDPQLHTVLQMERPDIVSHHAACRATPLPGQRPLTDADINLHGLLNLLDGCIAANVGRIIFASGGNDLYRTEGQALPLGEEAPLCPRRPLDISKLAGEWYIRYYSRHYGIEHVILRYADVYGEIERQTAQHPLTEFIYSLLEKKRVIIRAPKGEKRDHIYISDVIQAHLLALERGSNCTIHISSGTATSLEEFYQRAAALLSASEVAPLYLNERGRSGAAVALDNSRARQILGWQPTIDLEEGIRRTAQGIYANLGHSLPPVPLPPILPRSAEAPSTSRLAASASA